MLGQPAKNEKAKEKAKKEGGKEEKKDKKKKKKEDKKQEVAAEPATQKRARDPTGKAFLAEVQEWLRSPKNSEHIKYVKTDEGEHTFHFTIGDEDLKFEVAYPVDAEDVWTVSSEDLSEDWVSNTLDFALGAKRVGEVLMYCTQQYSALSDEELSDGEGEDQDDDDDDDDLLDEDGFAFEVKQTPKKKGPPEPEVDVSQFVIPADYEPSGIQSIIQQYRDILRTSRAERGYDATPLKDSIAQWEVKLFNIPKDEPLYQDMKQLGLEHITLHVTFPPNFPFSPPFIRVVRPRFAFRTGHVTVGGSICTLMLTNDGWIATYRLDQVMVDIGAMLTSGGGRLDLSNRSDYSEEEAMVAFRRMLDTHGWKHWKR